MRCDRKWDDPSPPSVHGRCGLSALGGVARPRSFTSRRSSRPCRRILARRRDTVRVPRLLQGGHRNIDSGRTSPCGRGGAASASSMGGRSARGDLDAAKSRRLDSRGSRPQRIPRRAGGGTSSSARATIPDSSSIVSHWQRGPGDDGGGGGNGGDGGGSTSERPAHTLRRCTIVATRTAPAGAALSALGGRSIGGNGGAAAGVRPAPAPTPPR